MYMYMYNMHIIPVHCNAIQVSVIKAKISTEFGMPSGKQKLQIGVQSSCVFISLVE